MSALPAIREEIHPPAERTPPHSLDAETALLGSLLQANRYHEAVVEFLKPEHFASPAHARIFDAIGQLLRRGQRADQITLRQYLETDGELAQVGGWPYIVQLAHSMVSLVNAVDYARTVHELALRRRLIEFGQDAIEIGYSASAEMTATGMLEEVERGLSHLASETDPEGEPKSLAQIEPSYLAQIEAVAKATASGGYVGVSTGIRDLDRLVGTLKSDRLYTLAGRTSMGKTAMLVTIAHNAALAGKGVLFFSLEMSAEQLVARLNAAVSSVDTFRQHNELVDSELDQIVIGMGKLRDLPIFIDDRPGLSVAQMRARARRMKRRGQIDLLLVDHMHITRPEDSKRQRHEQLSQITWHLKALSKELELPVMAAAQLNRGNEARDDKRPELRDLREAGGIEENTDTAILLHRDEYYLERAEPKQREGESTEKFEGRRCDWTDRYSKAKGLADVLVPKSRDGRAGFAMIAYSGKGSRFYQLQRQEVLG